MIGYLKGTITAVDEQLIILMVGGMGFEIMMLNDEDGQFSIGDVVEIYTYMHVRENEIGLYGFSTAMEKKLFNVLIGVSGIGPKSAMQMLAAASAQGIISAIVAGDEKLLSGLPGIGKKTAARLILELQEKIAKEFPTIILETPQKTSNKKKAVANAIENDLTDALLTLGYRIHEIKAMFEKTDIALETDVNVALKKSLHYLSGGIKDA